MVPKTRGDDSTVLWGMVGVLALICAASWFWCWRTDQRLWNYFLSPLVAGTVCFLCSTVAAFGVQIGLKRPRLSVPAIALTLALLCLVFLSKAWPELAWGAPRLKSALGSELLFENGKTHRLPIERITTAGIAKLSKRKGDRMTLAALRRVAVGLVIDGLAQAGDASLEWAEEEAKANKYGLWGGGSYEADLQEYERLKRKLEIEVN